MEFPPEDWFAFPAADFELAAPRITGDYTAEILAQARPNGRVMDHWRITLGGPKILQAEHESAAIIPAALNLPRVKISYQQWPRDIQIRRNMTSSAWMDIAGLLAAKELTATNLETGEAVTNPELVEGLSNLPDKTANSASCRWAVCISESSKLELQLQCLPAPINLLTGKPIFKRYTFNKHWNDNSLLLLF